MKDIWQFPVSYGYGNVPGYTGFHTGQDRGNSSAFGLPVTVNGVVIGTVGWTGKVEPKNIYGTHTHIGRFVSGQSTDPQGGGERLGVDATVTEVDVVGNTDNGKFVRVRSLGVDWVYLHLDSVRVKVGDKLKGEPMEPTDYKMNEGDVINGFAIFKRKPSKEDLALWTGQTFKKFQYEKITEGVEKMPPQNLKPYDGKELFVKE